jgi:two-component system, OmpR family, response regulator
MATILVVDDDPHIRDVVRFAVERAGHRVVEAVDGRQALERFETSAPDLLVLDILMPELDGLEVCRRLRATSDVPILFLSSRDDELDRILGLEMGGDDYACKPFSPRELVTRIKVILRRLAPREAQPSGEVLSSGELRLDLDRHRCFWGEQEVVLTVTEFELLRALLTAPGRAYSRTELADRAWEPGHAVADRTIDSHVRRIRAKLAAAGGEPIKTVHGYGYRLEA